VLRSGAHVRVWPSGRATRIVRIETFDGPLEQARGGQSVTVHLSDDLDVSRGDLISGTEEPLPIVTRELAADVAWLHDTPSRTGGSYLLKQGTRETRAILDRVEHRYDVATGSPIAPGSEGDGLAANALARIHLRTAEPLAVDPYEGLRSTGSFILVDAATGHTMAAGMIRAATPA